MTEVAAGFPSHLFATLLPPSSTYGPEYRIIFKFRDKKSLSVWEQSAERTKLLGELHIVSWFTLRGQHPVTSPPKYKMVLVSWLALYPSVSVVFILFGDQLAQLPILLRTPLVTMVAMIVMSYVLMPLMTRCFAFRLLLRRDIKDR